MSAEKKSLRKEYIRRRDGISSSLAMISDMDSLLKYGKSHMIGANSAQTKRCRQYVPLHARESDTAKDVMIGIIQTKRSARLWNVRISWKISYM